MREWLTAQAIAGLLTVAGPDPASAEFALAEGTFDIPPGAHFSQAKLARLGDYQHAAPLAEEVRKYAPADGLNLVKVSCCYALCAAAVKRGKSARATGLV